MSHASRYFLLAACLLAGSAWAVPTPFMGVADAQEDFALHRPVTGSPICKPGEEALKAVNGLIASKTQDKFCSLQKPSWLQIDLQSERTLHGFTLKHAGAGGEPTAMNTRAFTIQTSLDGKQWTTVVSVLHNTSNVSRHPITSTRARHVRLNVTQPTQTADPATRIYEFEAW
ncbi:MAG: discoidin domain-containing protein [Rhodanobacter sp.]